MAIQHSDPAGASRAPRRSSGLYYGYWIVVAGFVIQTIMVGSQLTVSGAFLGPMTEDLGWTRTEYTYSQTISQIVMAGVAFWLGTRVDRYGGRRFVIAGGILIGITLMATAEVQELWQWLLVRGAAFTVGAGLAGMLVVNVAVSKWWVRRRGPMIGFAAMGVSAAGILFPILTTALIDEFGWRMAWRIIAVLAVVLLIPSGLAMRRRPEDYGLHPDGLSDEDAAGVSGQQAASDFANSFTRAEALRTPALYLIILAFAVGGMGIGVMLFQAIPFLTSVGYSSAEAARFSALMSFASFLSKPFWGWTTNFLDARKGTAIGFVLAGGALAVVVFAANDQLTPVLFLAFLLLGFGFGSQIPLEETIWATFFGRRHLGAVRGVAMPFALGFAAIGPLGISWYYDRVGNYTGILLAASALWALAAVIIMLVRRPVKQQPAPVPEPAIA